MLMTVPQKNNYFGSFFQKLFVQNDRESADRQGLPQELSRQRQEYHPGRGKPQPESFLQPGGLSNALKLQGSSRVHPRFVGFK